MYELRNATLPDGRTGQCIRHAGGRIISIGAETSDQNIYLNARGLTVAPGLNLMHVHFRVPGGEEKEDWEHAVRAAIYGGVATVGDMPNTGFPLTSLDRLYEKIELVGARDIDYRFWFGATPGNLDQIYPAVQHPLVCGVKMFIGSSTGDLLVNDPDDQMRVFMACADSGVLLAVHAEDEAIIQKNLAQFENRTVMAHGLIRSPEAAITALERALKLQRETGCRLLVLHASLVEELRMIIQAKEEGREVYVETCPHYWVLDERQLCRFDGAFFKMNPPLRPPEQLHGFRKLVCTPGVVDLISPDHAPHTKKEKQGQLYSSPSGIPGVQELFPLTYQLVAADMMSMSHFIALTSTNAARLFNLPNGKVEPGYAADLVVFDPDEEVRFWDEDMQSKCGWTAYTGLVAKGAVKIVLHNGRVVLNRLMK